MNKTEIENTFGQSAQGNFKAIDSIGVPHPYYITPKHLEYSHGMYLDIEGAEKESRETYPNDQRKWAICDICRKLNRQNGTPVLSFADHKRALLIKCKIEANGNDELKQYLLQIKESTEKHGFAGWAFMKAKP